MPVPYKYLKNRFKTQIPGEKKSIEQVKLSFLTDKVWVRISHYIQIQKFIFTKENTI